jgi:hypothetical protein
MADGRWQMRSLLVAVSETDAVRVGFLRIQLEAGS